MPKMPFNILKGEGKQESGLVGFGVNFGGFTVKSFGFTVKFGGFTV